MSLLLKVIRPMVHSFASLPNQVRFASCLRALKMILQTQPYKKETLCAVANRWHHLSVLSFVMFPFSPHGIIALYFA